MRRAPRDEVAAFPVVVEARDSPFEFLKASHRWHSTSSFDDADDISDVAPIYSSRWKLQFVHFSTSTAIPARFLVTLSFRQGSNTLSLWRQSFDESVNISDQFTSSNF